VFNFWYYIKRRTRFDFKPVIVVTGAGSGIGLAIAELLHRYKSYRVVVTARQRSLPRLREKFPETDRFWVRPMDIRLSADRETLIEEIQRQWGGVNILINCAGISYRAVVEHMSAEDELLQMQTNYFGPVELIRLVLPHMREMGRGKIINVSSVSGMLAMPTMASYSASKYALEGMSEALWYEVKPLGINVSLIQPGFVRSDSFLNVYYSRKSKSVEGTDQPYGDYYANMTPFITRLMHMSVTGPAGIARTILKVIRTENPPLWVPATFDAFLFYYLRRFVPRRLLMWTLFQSLPKVRRWGRKYTHRRGVRQAK
jgi:NAD(P)-dependent dehydrogenase (short-subunit alcohol dehydrogenase family)